MATDGPAPRILFYVLGVISCGHLTLAVKYLLDKFRIGNIQIGNNLVTVIAHTKAHVLYVSLCIPPEIVGVHILVGMSVGNGLALEGRKRRLCENLLRRTIYVHHPCGVSILDKFGLQILLIPGARNRHVFAD